MVSGIREIAEKGGPKNADHTLNNVDTFIKWRAKLMAMSKEKEYYPELMNTIRKELADAMIMTGARNLSEITREKVQVTF